MTQNATRYHTMITEGEGGTIYAVVDSLQPEAEQPAVIHHWASATEPNARFLAEDFCRRHNMNSELDIEEKGLVRRLPTDTLEVIRAGCFEAGRLTTFAERESLAQAIDAELARREGSA